ncbi:MAG: PIG-L family deacetylase [Methanobacterium sp.]|nr:PIG-L family deacetylase [Methanobacterium sp.]
MLKKRYIIALLVIIISIAFISLSSGNYPIKPGKNINKSLIQSEDRVLIIAVHPDDESIASAGVISYCIEHNIPLKIVVLTDGYLGSSAVTRHDESIAAMKILGVNPDNIIFLGYPDGSLPSLLTKNWESNNPYKVNNTTNNANYTYSYQKNATYSGTNLYHNLAEIMSNFQPTIIFYPDSEDEQIDHWAGNAFTEYVMAQTNYNGSGYTYIVHDPPHWPSPRTYTPEAYLLPPPELTYINYKFVLFPLDQYQERLKEAAIGSYPSQINTDSYIRSFIRKNEIFAIAPLIKASPTNQSLNFSNPPQTVIKEPKKFEKGKGSIRSREITAVGFQMDDGNAWISIKTKNNLSLEAWYEVHILYLDDENLKRIDIKIHNGTAYYEKYNQNSFQDGHPELKISENDLIMKLPQSAFDDDNLFLISADIISGNTLIDWTGWREIQIIR